MEGQAVQSIVKEYFGPVVGRVVGVLNRRGPLSLAMAVHLSGMPGRQVKEALYVLLQHGYVEWRETGAENAVVEYVLLKERVLFLLFGMPWLFMFSPSVARDSMVELFVMGMIPMNSAKHSALLAQGLVETVQSLGQDSKSDDSSPKKKRQRTDHELFVRISFSGCLALWRRALVVEHVSQVISKAAGQLVSHIWDSHEGRMTAGDLGKRVPEEELLIDWRGSQKDTRAPAVHYTETLARRLPFVHRSTVSSPHDRTIQTCYRIDQPSLVSYLEQIAYLSIVESRLSSEAARIARCLFQEGPLSDKVIGEKLLMTAKEVRELCFRLLALGLLHLQEIPRTLDHAPSRTIFLWSLDLRLIRRNLTTRFYKIIQEIGGQLEELLRVNHELVSKATLQRPKLSEGERQAFIKYSHEREQLLLKRSCAFFDSVFFLLPLFNVTK